MTWTGQSFSAGQVLTATQMNNLQADIAAQANGDSGAPKNKLASMNAGSVDSDQIVAAAVSQAKLDTAMSAVQLTGAGPTLFTLPGGEYGFYPQVKTSDGTTFGIYEITHSTNSTAYATRISITRASGSGNCDAQQRYIQASPPYDLGDGAVALFMFLLIDNSSSAIVASCIAPEAPWHLNGPTVIKSDFYRDGKPYRMVRQVPAELQSIKSTVDTLEAKMSSGQSLTDEEVFILRDFYIGMQDAKTAEIEIDQASKQADMPLLPHPFIGNDLSGKTVVLLDPVSVINERLLDFMVEEGATFELNKMLRDGFFSIGNTAIARAGPPGVMSVAYSWRQT